MFFRSKLKHPQDLLKKIEKIKADKPNAFSVDHKGKKFLGEKMLATVPAVSASLVIQDLTLTADVAGLGGNAISLTYTSGAVAGAEVVTVSGNDITVQISAGVSTASQIKTALDAHAGASALVNVAVSGLGTNAQATQAKTLLAGGADSYVAPACNLTGDSTKITFTYEGVNYQLLLSDIKIAKRIRSRKYVFHTDKLTVI